MDINSYNLSPRKNFADQKINLQALTLTNFIKKTCGINNEDFNYTDKTVECINTTSKKLVSLANLYNSKFGEFYTEATGNEFVDSFSDVFFEAVQTDDEDDDDEDDEDDDEDED